MRPVAKYRHAQAHEAHHATVRALRGAVHKVLGVNPHYRPWTCDICGEVVK